VQAIFWGQERSKRVAPPRPHRDIIISAEDFSQVKQEKEMATVVELPLTLTVSVISSISQIPADHWDACALDSTGPESANPFITHAFLSSLEDSKSALPVSSHPLLLMCLLRHLWISDLHKIESSL
jgi:hypothetical protein